MARKATLKHPFTKDEYTLLSDGTVQVKTPSGETGVFAGPNQWVSGELKHADTKMLLWMQATR